MTPVGSQASVDEEPGEIPGHRGTSPASGPPQAAATAPTPPPPQGLYISKAYPNESY